MKYREEDEEEGGEEDGRETARRTRRWGGEKEDELSAADGILLRPPGLQSGCLATAVA